MNVFDQVEKDAEGLSTRTSWRGILSIQSNKLVLPDTEFHLKGGKAHGELAFINPEDKITTVDQTTGKEVEKREVVRLYRYEETNGVRTNYSSVGYEEAKDKVRYLNEDGKTWKISGRNESIAFDKAKLSEGIWQEILATNIVKMQNGQIIKDFERTKKIEVRDNGVIPLENADLYLFKSLYMLDADSDPKVRESPKRIFDFARLLLDRQCALIASFSWGRGTNYYNAVIFPYENKSTGQLWLLMGMSEGKLTLDIGWTLENIEPERAAQSTLTAVTPKVKISK